MTTPLPEKTPSQRGEEIGEEMNMPLPTDLIGKASFLRNILRPLGVDILLLKKSYELDKNAPALMGDASQDGRPVILSCPKGYWDNK